MLEKAAEARIKGVEAEIVLRPAEGLELSGNASHLDSEFTRSTPIRSSTITWRWMLTSRAHFATLTWPSARPGPPIAPTWSAL